MTPIQAGLMGIVQGLTEFLPISSSGHLALSRHLLNVAMAEDISFEVAVHAGTLIAVLIYFRLRIVELVRDTFKGDKNGWRYIGYLFIGTIPAAAIGLPLEDHITVIFNSLTWVGIAWIVTAIILFTGEWLAKGKLSDREMGWLRAVGIGFAQALALIPGISRSGSTIAMGLMLKLDRRSAVDFAFLLSLPAVGGATILTIPDWVSGNVGFGIEHIIGGLAAAISGYFAIAWMIRVVAGAKLRWFALYCLILGILSITLS
ncbi:undecaprenyl-diphosphate phosphatase [Calditrichota bacterium]